ncbi:MAG: Rieske 2Fe-2S domain-containing protein [Candidatus Kapaibacterium sp.]
MNTLPILENQQRRGFCKNALLTTGGVLCSGLILSALQGCETDINKVSLTPTGNTFTINTETDEEIKNLIDGQGIKRLITQNNKSLNNNIPVIIIKISATEYKVFTSLCTHEANPIEPPDPRKVENPYEGKNIWCKVHDSFFDVNGKVVEGPAKSSLREFSTNFDSITKILTING